MTLSVTIGNRWNSLGPIDLGVFITLENQNEIRIICCENESLFFWLYNQLFPWFVIKIGEIIAFLSTNALDPITFMPLWYYLSRLETFDKDGSKRKDVMVWSGSGMPGNDHKQLQSILAKTFHLILIPSLSGFSFHLGECIFISCTNEINIVS